MRRLLACALLGASLPAQTWFSARLDGNQEVPPVATNASGFGLIRFDPGTSQVRVFVQHESLSAAPTAAHLHLAPVGANGGVVLNLAAAGPNAFTGTGTLSPAAAGALVANGTYLNLHTPTHPGGEIRGQVVAGRATRLLAQLDGSQEVPPVATAATGSAVAFLYEPDDRLVFMVDATGLPNITAVHLHQGLPGSNGPVLFPLAGQAGQYIGASPRLTPLEAAAVRAGATYFNVHTAANPGGEIRGQLQPVVPGAYGADISQAQSVPPTGSSGIGGASLVRRPDGSVAVRGRFTGLTGAVTVAHVHVAAPGSNGPVVFPLSINGDELSGSFTPAPGQLLQLDAGDWYVNVHSTAHPGGEIRGQLVPVDLPQAFGGACTNPSGRRAAIGARGVPTLGSAITIDLYDAMFNTPQMFVFGSSRDTIGPATPLPVELATLGLNSANCWLQVRPDSLLLAVTDGLGRSELEIDLPLTPALRGMTFYSQWVGVELAQVPLAFTASNALEFRLQ